MAKEPSVLQDSLCNRIIIALLGAYWTFSVSLLELSGYELSEFVGVVGMGGFERGRDSFLERLADYYSLLALIQYFLNFPLQFFVLSTFCYSVRAHSLLGIDPKFRGK